VQLKRELGNTSPQDNFSKWAKLDRQHNKAVADFQKIGMHPHVTLCTPLRTFVDIFIADGSLRTHQATFTSGVSTLRWLGTQGLRFILQFWFAKSPMFWVPAGWLPYYVEWMLSFPRAPLGSVSINVWGVACASMIALASEGLAAVWVLVTHTPTPAATEKAREKEEAMAFKAEPRSGQKKEL
jgi:hypothetical protein